MAERESYCYSREGVQCPHFLRVPIEERLMCSSVMRELNAAPFKGFPIAVPAWCPLLKVEGREKSPDLLRKAIKHHKVSRKQAKR